METTKQFIEVKQRIINLSQEYHQRHGVTDGDVETALKIIAHHKEMDNSIPCPGDIVICKGPKRTYYKGHLDDYCDKDSYSNICTQPYTPFVFPTRKGGIYCDTSGGYWLSCKDSNELKLKGQAKKQFKTWGHCGATGAGAFYFEMIVNVWEYDNSMIY